MKRSISIILCLLLCLAPIAGFAMEARAEYDVDLGQALTASATPVEENGGMNGQLIALLGLIVFAAALTATVLIMKKRK